MTHYTVQFKSAILELGIVGSMEQERFQGTLENLLAWNASAWVLLAGGSMHGGGNRKRPLVEFQTGPGNDVVAVWRVAKSRQWWDLSDCSQHASQVRWRLANSRFVHVEAQFMAFNAR